MDSATEVSVYRVGVCSAAAPEQDEELCTLHGSVRELRAELEDFRRGVDRQLEDVLRLAGPLSRSVTDLQAENRQLREQVERLSRQVELLSRAAGLSSEGQARYSSHTVLAVSSKNQSIVPEEQNDDEATRASTHPIVENGHQSLSEKVKTSQDASSAAPIHSTQEHHPALMVRKPHMPVTAMTKIIAEPLPGSTNGSSIQPVHELKSTLELTPRSSNSQEKGITVSKSSQSYSVSSSSVISESSDRYFDVTPKSQSPPPAVSRQAERKRELVRSQTLPRSSGTQARKAFFEKFDDSAKGKGESKVKLKRSQSFGVASASSIKQILLEWCRSKTIGYKKIDLQNFSSSWNDGIAFCALVHSFFPEAFDYDSLESTNHKQNFEMAFSTAEKFANCDRLIEVEDMLMMGKKPDPMCVFTYVQSLYNHLRRFE